MRRRTIAAGGALVAIGAAAAGGYLVAGSTDNDASADSTPDAGSNLTYVPVTLGDLVRNEELGGKTGYGTAAPIVLSIDGTLTKLPTIGQVINPGDVVAEIDGRPIIAATGDVPMWRDLSNGVDDGVDVQQVEEMLAALGYAEEHDVTVDQEWTYATTEAVEAFQEDRGQDDDGVINKGELLFVDGPIRVSKVAGVEGQATADAGIEVTGVDPVVGIDLDADDSDLVEVGDELTVELSDGREVPGTVTEIGAAVTDEEGDTTVPVEVTIDADVIGALTDGSAVDVFVPVVSAENVLTVPVEALLAVADGGFAVEVKGGATGTHLVGVDTGAFADGRVEITGTTGEIAEGDEVVVP